MSDYHVLSVTDDGNEFSVVMHIPVNDTVNSASVNYRTALIEYLGGSQPSSVPFITGAEQTQLDNGELYEHTVKFQTYPGESGASKQARLDTLFGTVSTNVQAAINFRLSYWGQHRK